MKNLIPFLSTFFVVIVANAQDSAANSLFTSELKSYVVIGVLLIIFSLLFAFLFWLENRINKLEGK